MRIETNLGQFRDEVSGYSQETYPEAIALGMRDTALGARDAARSMTRGVFDLHTEYIPDGILSTPFKPNQMKAAEKAFRGYGDAEAAVFLRPGDATKSLDFLLAHQYGGEKMANGYVAIPLPDLKGYGYQTATGRTAKRWKPSSLLKEFNARGGRIGGNVKGTKLKGDSRRLPFIRRESNGSLNIVRRVSKTSSRLAYLYHLKEEVQIDKTWDFEGEVKSDVNKNYASHFMRAFKRKGL